MIYIVVFILLSSTAFLFTKKKNKNAQKTEERKQQLINKIDEENSILQRIYNSSKDINKSLNLKYIGKRLIAYGQVDDFLIMLKYKNGKLRIGVPCNFQAETKYYDIEADLSDLKDDTQFISVGAENFFHYYAYSEKNTSDLSINIREVVAIINTQEQKQERKSFTRYSTISQYETAILSSRQIYN